MLGTTRKRNRVPKSCSLCRAKKIKCDRIHPICNVCSNSGISSLCQYEEASWAGSLTSSGGSVSALDDYNNSRMTDKTITDSPYQSAARIPIAFMPAAQNPVESKRRKVVSNSNAEADTLSELQSQITKLSETVSILISTINSNNKSQLNGFSPIGDRQTPESLHLSSPPVGNLNIQSNVDFIDFYANYKTILVRKSRVMYHGPFSLFSTLRKDKFLSIGRKLLHGELNKEQDSEKNSTLDASRLSSKKEVIVQSVEEIKATLGGQIQSALPHKKAIWLFIKRFFDFVYPFYPFISKDSFIDTISEIIGSESYIEEPVNVKIQSRIDFAHMGLLLLVLRMAYLSVISNMKPIGGDDAEDELHDYLSAITLSFNLVSIAQLCLNQFRILRKADIPTFQLALYLRIYNRQSPEYDGHIDTFDIQIFTGLLFQIAIAIGLHEDPLEFEQSELHLRRKMWYYLKSLDVEESLSTGVPLRLYNINSCTRLPEFIRERPGVLEDVLENRIVKNIQDEHRWAETAKVLVSMVSGYQPCRIEDVLNCLSELTKYSHAEHSSLNSIMKSTTITDDVTKCRTIKKYLDVKTILMRVYHHLMLHYEEFNDFDSARRYLLLSLNLNSDILANYNFRNINKTYLSCGCEYLYYPFQSVSLTSFLLQFSLFLRIDKVAAESSDQKRRDSLDNIKETILKNFNVFLFAKSKFATTYYTTWRSVKSIFQITRSLEESGFYLRDGDNVVIKMEVPHELEAPTKNFFKKSPESFVLELHRLVGRDNFKFLLVKETENCQEGLNQPCAYYEAIINDETWTKHKKSKLCNRFYANLSNHNISYDGLTDNINNLFNDLIDF